MDKFLVLLQNLQDTYASQTGMCMVVTDAQGKYQTRPSGRVDWLTWMAEDNGKNSLCDECRKVMGMFQPMRQAIEYEYKPGIKLLVAPVQVDGFGPMYLWAGFFTETRTRRILQEYYASEENQSQPARVLQEAVPELNGEQKRLLGEKVGALAEIASSLTTISAERRWNRQQMAVVRQLAAVVDRTDTKIRDLLQLYYQAQRGLDFLGFAAKLDETRFQIAEVLGEAGLGLTGSTFSMGEGVLGHVASTRQWGRWSNLSRDPRTLFFTQNNVHPEALFAFPITKDYSVTGILFGGTRRTAEIPEEIIDLAQMITSLLSSRQTFQALREDRNMNYLRLTMLMELCRTMTVVSDIKRVLFILIDMGLNLAQGAFSAIMLCRPEEKPRWSRGASNRIRSNHT
ncbi:hypothetical protein N6H14_13620 [Paenibacillus sp. CC-CFT747]|nr:hypothetical protein N6H14_13620 [Paenibacillus sp. CC-CFT747]